MRFSVVLSFFVAIALAGLAVFGARGWLDEQRLMLMSTGPQQIVAEPENTIVVAAEPISFGERLNPAKLREIAWSSDVIPEGAFATTATLVPDDSDENARFALTTMTVGEPILASKVTMPGQRAKLSTALTPGMKAISIRVNDVLGVAGFVLPGDRVDVLLTRRDNREGSFVDVLLQGVRVLAIDQIADELKDKPSVVRTVTFEVNTAEAQKLVLAGTIGTLSLALRNVASNDVESNDRITLADLSDMDVAEDLIPEPVPVEVEPDANSKQLDAMQVLLKSTLDGISDRLSSVEDKIQKPDPVQIEKLVERVVIAPPPKAEKATVAVIRDGRRDEYKVQPGLAGSQDVRTTGGPELLTVQLEE
ncbi:Flp pilus assembly protein CpaB [Alloyangia pacifica]|uniref:Flp pilus assembly protein CpaB n=1 Tax=Alloyangia pacifica TaxID=311180 RepID=UPI001CFD37A8|nr:Flp pilus assembly protein CpaB [Alloyangia pacifica]